MQERQESDEEVNSHAAGGSDEQKLRHWDSTVLEYLCSVPAFRAVGLLRGSDGDPECWRTFPDIGRLQGSVVITDMPPSRLAPCQCLDFSPRSWDYVSYVNARLHSFKD